MKHVVLILGTILAMNIPFRPANAQTIQIQQRPVMEHDTREVLYRDFLLTMLSPYIQKAIENYYKQLGRNFALYQAQIKDIKRLCGKGQFYFEATVVVELFTGAHNPTNEIDTITLTNYPPSKASVPQKPYVPHIYVLRFQHRDIKPSKHLPIRRNC